MSVAVKEKVTVQPVSFPFIWRLGTRRSAARLLERAVEGVVRVTEASSRKSLPVVMLV